MREGSGKEKDMAHRLEMTDRSLVAGSLHTTGTAAHRDRCGCVLASGVEAGHRQAIRISCHQQAKLHHKT